MMSMEYYDKVYCLRVQGDYACFTRPEMKVERVSYDVITPSAARAIFQAIYWKPAIQWEITRIEVLNPIEKCTIMRNEVGAVMSTRSQTPIEITEQRRQKTAYLLKNVDYRIYARMRYIPIEERSLRCQQHFEKMSEAERQSENPGKHQAIFERRARAGQCFMMPYLGCREFTCSFELEEDTAEDKRPISENRDLGYMLFDLDFGVDGPSRAEQAERKKKLQKPTPLFFHAEMKEGVIEVPPKDSEEVKR